MTIESYMREVCNQPALSEEEETALAQFYAETKDPLARAKIIAANLRLVVQVARGYTRNRVILADLIQEGSIGLCKALDGFESGRGCRFSTYAVYYVRGEMLRFLVENASKSIPDDDEMSAAALREQLDQLTNAADQRPDALVEQSQVLRARERVGETIKELLAYFEQTMSEREREIFQSLWRSEKRSPLRELARRHGITPRRVHQIDVEILKQLKIFLGDRIGDALAAC